ncbi:hypothetical protein Nepgr_005579 [Nepenthes gracilis]|uniref:Dof zinc finger protein n=1 Tax=Nepenthes gracilis TaxID=150966 RepID=A0AAD3S3S2_NEPGR|nr:hypothetical protein Nepgr_005579 [Nepenthes gracilis]
MQDPTAFAQLRPHVPEQEQLKCPRCESTNTKFCYYNNYNLSQPRHFCKSCRRYWTKGGALRNIPVGGGSRKNSKRPSNSKRQAPNSSYSAHDSSTQNPYLKPEPVPVIGSDPAVIDHNQDSRLMDIPGSFSSLLASNGQFGNFMDGLNSSGSDLKFCEDPILAADPNSGLIGNPGLKLQSRSDSSEGFLGNLQSGDSSCWGNGDGHGWPDLSIYTPGSNFHELNSRSS